MTGDLLDGNLIGWITQKFMVPHCNWIVPSPESLLGSLQGLCFYHMVLVLNLFLEPLNLRASTRMETVSSAMASPSLFLVVPNLSYSL